MFNSRLETTNDYKKLKANPELYTWGKILRWHEIGGTEDKFEYSIVEYHPWKRNGCTILTGQVDTEKVEFSCYSNEIPLNESTNTLDGALLVCLSRKYDGHNTHLPHYIMRMFQTKEVDY